MSFDISTYCLRTGDRCLSYWLNPDDAKILTFAKNQFVLANRSSDSTCKDGGPAHREITLQYPLPTPAQDPITLLTGNGHYTITGACRSTATSNPGLSAPGTRRVRPRRSRPDRLYRGRTGGAGPGCSGRPLSQIGSAGVAQVDGPGAERGAEDIQRTHRPCRGDCRTPRRRPRGSRRRAASESQER